jgi:hypothetical protein
VIFSFPFPFNVWSPLNHDDIDARFTLARRKEQETKKNKEFVGIKKKKKDGTP